MPGKRPKRSKEAKEKPKPFIPTSRHQFVPPHELLSRENGLAVLERFATPIERLPRIRNGDPGLLTDPAYRAAVEAGEDLVGRIVRVRRISQTAGEAEVYRVITVGSGE